MDFIFTGYDFAADVTPESKLVYRDYAIPKSKLDLVVDAMHNGNDEHLGAIAMKLQKLDELAAEFDLAQHLHNLRDLNSFITYHK